MKTAAGASEKKEEGKTLERRISLKGLTMKEIEHAQTLFEKYDTNYDKKIDKEEFLQLWKDLTAAKGEKEGAYALKKKAADGYEVNTTISFIIFPPFPPFPSFLYQSPSKRNVLLLLNLPLFPPHFRNLLLEAMELLMLCFCKSTLILCLRST